MPATTADGFPYAVATDPLGQGHQSTQDMAEFLQDQWTPWTAYTPNIDDLTLGNGTISAAWRRLFDTVDFRFKLTLGTTSVVTGSMQLEYAPAGLTPLDPADTLVGTLLARDASVPKFLVGVLNPSPTGFAYMVFNDTTLGANATVPWTWGNGDEIRGLGRFQIDL